jgi:hypothetical protein
MLQASRLANEGLAIYALKSETREHIEIKITYIERA